MAGRSPLRTGINDRAALISNAQPVDTVQFGIDQAGEFERGLRTGAAGMSAGSFASEALDQELAGQDPSSLRARALEQQALAQQSAPTVGSFRDVNSLGSALDYGAGAIGQGAVSMAPTLAGAALAVGSRGALRNVLPYVGAAVPAYNLEYNEQASNQLSDPAQMAQSPELRQQAARAKGGVNAALESIVPAGLASTVGRATGKGFLETVGKNALEEGLTEATQERVGQIAGQVTGQGGSFRGVTALGNDPDSLINAGLQGALTGGAVSAPVAATNVAANKTEAGVDAIKGGAQTAAQAVSEGVQTAKTRIDDELNEKFGDTDGELLDKVVNGPAQAAQGSFSEILDKLKEYDAKRPELVEKLKERAQTWGDAAKAKFDPEDPDSMISALKEKDWAGAADSIKSAASKLFKGKSNLQRDIDPLVQGDAQVALLSNIKPEFRDLESVRKAVPELAQRMLALAARTGGLTDQDLGAALQLRGTLGDIFEDPQAAADAISSMGRGGFNGMKQILDIESASTDAQQPNSFLELSMTPAKRAAGFNLKKIGRAIDELALSGDVDPRSREMLRALFGSDEKGEQVLEYYRAKIKESAGVELPEQELNDEPEDFDARLQGINSQDLSEQAAAEPRHFFASAKTKRPFLRSEKKGEPARQKLAQVLAQARAEGADNSNVRPQVIGHGDYIAQSGGDPAAEVERRLADATKRREAALKKGKELAAKKAPESQLEHERKKVMDANKELRILTMKGEDPRDQLNELYQVVQVNEVDPSGTKIDDNDVFNMGRSLRQRTADPAKDQANKATKLDFTNPAGNPISLSAHDIARVTSAKLEKVGSNETGTQRTRRAFAEGVANLLGAGYRLVEGQDLGKVSVDRRTGLTGSPQEGAELDANPWKSTPLSQSVLARQKELEASTKPVDMLDIAASSYKELKDLATDARGPRRAALNERARSAKEAYDNALRKVFPMPEQRELEATAPDSEKEDALLDYRSDLESLLSDVQEFGDADLSKAYEEAIQKRIDGLLSEGAGRLFEEDTGLGIGVERRGSREQNPSAVRAGQAEASKLSSQGFSNPAQAWSAEDQATVLAEIERQRGADIKAQFDDFANIGGSGSYTYNAQTGERLIKIAMQSVNPMAVAWHESLHDFMQMLTGDKATTRMAKELLAVANSQPVINQLRKLLDGHPDARTQIETDQEERLAYAYQFFLSGQLRVGTNTQTLFGKIQAFLNKLFRTVTTGDRAEQYFISLHSGQMATDTSIAAEIQALAPTYADRAKQLSDLIGNIGEKLLSSTTQRLRDTDVKALSEVADAFHVDPDQQQPKTLPFLQRRTMAQGVWANKAFQILEGASDVEIRTALANLQAQNPPSSTLEQDIRAFLDDMHAYQDKAGVKRLEREQVNGKWVTKEVPLKKVANYFPRIWDIDKIEANKDAWIEAVDANGGDGERTWSNMLGHRDSGKADLQNPDNFTPWNQSLEDRVFDFVENNPADFVEFQNQDMADILNTFVNQAVHRSEYARQFGNQGQWLEEKFEEAKQQGASSKDIRMARDAVQGLQGTLQYDMNPKLRRVMSGIITAQNLILLPLSLFSQVVDAMAIGARANSWGESLKALDAGFKAVARSFTKNADNFSKDERLAMDLGIIDESAMLEAMGMAYSGMDLSKRMKSINKRFFKINRMEQWNRAMRAQATVTGQRFILANQDNPRYMEELGLDPSDVVEMPNGDLAVTEDDGLSPTQARKIRSALFKFVDSAVLRPNAAHRPIWGNDPRFMLLMHLKQFSFTFQNTILKSMKKELQFGNVKPLMVLMGAIPAIMISDLAKAAMLGNIPADMTFASALGNGIARSGLLGTRSFGLDAAQDPMHGNLPGTSFLGPSFEHATTIAKGLLGTATPGEVIERSVPGGAVVRAITD